MTTRWLATTALAAVCLAALLGCDDGSTAPTASSASPSPSTVGSTVSATPTPSKSLTPDQQDLRDAEESIKSYWTVLDQVASDPKADLNVLATVARGQALAQWQSTLTDYRSKGWIQQGTASVVAPAASKKSGKKFEVSACIDVSELDVVDASGKSVVAKNRPLRQRYTYEVEEAPQGFFVTVDTFKAQPCVA